MTKLYTAYAQLYHLMYQGLIDYPAEFNYYQRLVDQYKCKSILEIGCGTGQLGRRFIEAGYSYQGLDISAEMLAYAREHLPPERVHQQDMRNIQLADQFDAVLITARSLSYLRQNQDLLQTFESIKKVLLPDGILVFDFIDACSFMPQIEEGKVIEHLVDTPAGQLKRESKYALSIAHNWCWIWTSRFFQGHADGTYTPIGEDVAELRAFTSDEMSLFLKLSGFRVNELLSRPVYAFETKVVVAQI